MTDLQTEARAVGALYLVIIVGALFAEVLVRQRVLVAGDPAATSHAIRDPRSPYRTGYAVSVVYLSAHVPMAVLLHHLFAPTSPLLAATMGAFLLMAAALETANSSNHPRPLELLAGIDHTDAATAPAVREIAHRTLAGFNSGFATALVFFAGFCFTVGLLVLRSDAVPDAIGVAMLVGGACYPINSMTLFVAPGLGGWLSGWILVPCFVAEVSFTSWLLVKGWR